MGFALGLEFELSVRPVEISSRLRLVHFGQRRSKAGDKFLFIHIESETDYREEDLQDGAVKTVAFHV